MTDEQEALVRKLISLLKRQLAYLIAIVVLYVAFIVHVLIGCL